MRELGLGRQVQVGEQGLPGAQHVDLARLGLLDLQHELGFPEHRAGVGHDPRALGGELRVVHRATLAGAGLHQHLVTARAQLAHARRSDRHAILVQLDLTRDPDDHLASSLPRSASQNSMRSRALEKSRPVSCSTRLIR